jgi:uncharacterized protein
MHDQEGAAMADMHQGAPTAGGEGEAPAGVAEPASGRSTAGATLVEPRRRDRAKDEAWIRTFLRQAPFGFLATVEDGRPFLNSNLFVFDEDRHAIYLHTARTGRTPEAVDRSGPATFSAAVMGRLLPASEALEFSVEYAGVVVYGTAHPVDDDVEKRRILQLILDKYAPHLEPGRDYRPIVPEELRRTAVHRLDVESWSGKEKTVPRDFPGAYTLEAPVPPIVGGADASP